MKIALAGPVSVQALRPWLDVDEGQPLPPGLAGGPVTPLAVELLRRGHQVTVVTLRSDVSPGTVLQGSSLAVHLGHYRPRHRARDAFRAEREAVRSSLEAARPDVVHAHWTYEFALGALATGLPTLVTVHDWAPRILRLIPDPYRAVRFGMNAVTFARARRLAAVSPYIQQRIARLPARSAVVVPNGLPDDAFRRRDRPRGWPPLILSVNAGYGRVKNVAVLLRAFTLIRSRVPGARLRLVGEGYERRGPADQLARALGIEQSVELLGPLPHDRIARLMDSADVLAHPSLEESFGLVVAEAMARGLPVVGGRASGAVPWLLDEGRAGILTDVTSPRAMAEALLAVLEDVSAWERCAVGGFDRAWSSFRIASTADGYQVLYRELASGAGA